MTKPTDPGSSLKFAGEYVLGLANEVIEAVSRYLNPVVPGAELATGKGYESSFKDDKSRLESGVELAAVFIRGEKRRLVRLRLPQKLLRAWTMMF